jgi:hypothetical protein
MRPFRTNRVDSANTPNWFVVNLLTTLESKFRASSREKIGHKNKLRAPISL